MIQFNLTTIIMSRFEKFGQPPQKDEKVEKNELPVDGDLKVEKEQNERINTSLEVSFDTKILDELILEYPEQEEMLETFKKLPPIKLEKGVTFVFGANGSGKTTLANAIYYAASTAFETKVRNKNKEDAMQSALNRSSTIGDK